MTTQNATAKRTNCGKTHICMKLKVACTPIEMFWASDRGEQSEWSVCVAMAMWPLAEVSSLCHTYPEYKARRTNHDWSWTVVWYGVTVFFHFVFLSISCWGFLFVCLGIGSLFFCLFKPKHIIVTDVLGERFYVAAANSRRQKSTRIYRYRQNLFFVKLGT